ncbi:MAG: BRO family protein [Oceanicaulis sp.]
MIETRLLPYSDDLNLHVGLESDQHWFRAADIADAVGIADVALSLKNVAETEKASFEWRDDFGRLRREWFVTPAGTGAFIQRGHVRKSRLFNEWLLTHGLRRAAKALDWSQQAPRFVARYAANVGRVDAGHFSIISEFMIRVWGPLEQLGHRIADVGPDGRELRPDISVGRGFVAHLRIVGEIGSNISFYRHLTPNGEYDARQYPLRLLGHFNDYLHDDWIPNKAIGYFEKRDPAAVPFITEIRRRIRAHS